MTTPSGLRLAGALCTSLALGAVGCGGAEVKVAFDHQVAVATAGTQALTLDDGRTPTVFGMKLVTMYIVEDRTADLDSVGTVGLIWRNPSCDSDGTHCSILPEAGAYQVKDYFDLALPSSEVNAQLNGQGRPIDPGTYRYLHMDLAGPMHTDDRSVPNIQFGNADGSHEIRLTNNGYWVTLDPPLVVAQGDAVTVTLGYDLAGSFFNDPTAEANQPPAGTSRDDWYCGDTRQGSTHGPCLRFTGFVPAISH